MNRVLITGATGFIGHHLARRLLDEGREVLALVRNPDRLQLYDATPVTGDLLEPDELDIPDRIDTVFHLAGLTRAFRPKLLDQVNALGTACLIEAVKYRNPSAHFVYVSSLAAAGPAVTETLPVQESDTPRPVSRYGTSKLLGEMATAEGELPFTIVRPPAVFGPGERDIFTFIKMAARGIVILPGLHERLFSLAYAPDLADALVNLAYKGGRLGETYHVTDGHTHSWTGFRNTLADILGRTVRTIRLPLALVPVVAGGNEGIARLRKKAALLDLDKWRELRHPCWICDDRKARAVTTWAETPHSQALEATIRWYRDHSWL